MLIHLGSRNIYLIRGHLFFLILVIMWIDIDSMEQKSIYRPYEYGYLVFMYWIPYLPYYFIKTRGAKGVLLLLGLILLLNLGTIFQWMYYFVS